MATAAAPVAADAIADWKALFAQGRALARWTNMLDRGRRAAIRQAEAFDLTPMQWTLRDLFLDLGTDLVPQLAQATVKPRVIALHADVVRIPNGQMLTLDGTVLIISARRLEIDGKATVRLDHRQTRTAQLLLYVGEIAGALNGVAVSGDGVRTLPIATQAGAAGLWLHATPAGPVLDPRPTLPVEWLAPAAPAWAAASASFQMAAALLASQPQVATSMLRHIARCAGFVPDAAAYASEWKELGRASARLAESGEPGASSWGLAYGGLLFRGTPAIERKRRADELERAATAVRVGMPYALLRTTAPAPDLERPLYVRHSAQPVGMGELNGQEQPLRSVTVTGAEIVIDAADRSQILQTYGGKTDLLDFTLHADTVVVKTGLHLPQCDVTIFCRALYFESQGAWIDTTPLGKTVREPMAVNGRDGEPAGSITLHIGRFGTSEANARHLRARGGKGEDPDDGGFADSPTLRYLRVLTEDDWKQLFTLTNRQVGTLTVDIPRWDKFADDKIVYVELKIGGKTMGTIGEKAEPGPGGAGLTPGLPGLGGSGGTVRSTLDGVFAYADVSGGVSGQARGPSTGNVGGFPKAATWLLFEDQLDGGVRVLQATREVKLAAKGPDSAPGPLALEPHGTAGGCEPMNEARARHSWRTALNLGVAVQVARDALASAHPALAREVLVPYLPQLDAPVAAAAPADVGAGAAIAADDSDDADDDDHALSQLTGHAADLADQALRNADDFGNPPGWVPMLSLEATVDAYLSTIRPSMAELYTAYCLQRAWKIKADRQAALQSYSKLLSDETQETRTALAASRNKVPQLVAQLKDLLNDIKKTSEALRQLQTKIERRNDHRFASDEGKNILSSAFKILGAVVKAIPLPEPYQAATAGLGMVFDTAGNFIGDPDKAFGKLDTDLGKFSEDQSANLASLANSGLADAIAASGKEITALQEAASATRKSNLELSDLHDEAAAEHDKSIKKETQLYEMLKEALLHGRDPDKVKLLAEAGGLTKEFQKYKEEKEAALSSGTKEYQAQKKLMDGQDRKIAAKKKEMATQNEKLAEKKAASQKAVKQGVAKLRALASGVETIKKSVDALSVPKAQLNSQWDKALAQLQLDDPEFQTITAQLAFLNLQKAKLTGELARLQAELTEQKNTIAGNLVAVHELSMQMASAHSVLAPEVAVYAQALGQSAHRDLQQFLYFVVKAWEYQCVKPWGTPHHDAQKLFDDMRNVLEPSDYKYAFVDEADGEARRKQLQRLLDEPAPERNGQLTPDEFKLLRVVYEKPLRDMGKDLLRQLMAGGAASETRAGITLRAAQLAELNGQMQRSESASTPFDLVALRQLDLGKEGQRFVDIRVTKVRCRTLEAGGELPDAVVFRISRRGKSLVRAHGKIYAFEPEDGGERASARSFETSGGKHAGAGWRVEEGGTAVLEGEALWGPEPTVQGSLLAQLLAGEQQPKAGNLVKLSDFRPGVFSDFALSVTVMPPDKRIVLEEVELLVSTEGSNAPDREWMVCVATNVPQLIAITTNRPDIAGHSGGLGRYLGVFSRADVPVELSVPARFGALVHSGWLVDGQPRGGGPTIALDQSRYVVALYEEDKAAKPVA